MSHEGAYSARVDRALKLAAIIHDRQRRKGTRVPYIMHPVQVARILDRHGYAEALVIAALLHDVIEDVRSGNEELDLALAETFPALDRSPAQPDEMIERVRALVEREFGARVRRLVDAVTEQKREGGVDRPWMTRKRESLETLASASRADPDIAALKAADALHNTRSIAQDLATGGVRIMGRFTAEPHEAIWYYRRVADTVHAILGDVPLARELRSSVDDLSTTLLQVHEHAQRNLERELEGPDTPR